MTNMQRMKNDISTEDKREMTDKTLKENRARNDELTDERRTKADKSTDEHRLRNDELTADRRELKDGTMSTAMAVFLVALIVLATGTVFVLM